MRALGLGTLMIALLAVSALVDQETGVGIWLELRDDLSASTARVTALARENEALRREIEILEAEPAAVDRAIREELDLVLPGEVVVRFARAEGSPAGPDGDRDRASRRFANRLDFDHRTGGQSRSLGAPSDGGPSKPRGSEWTTQTGVVDDAVEREQR